MIDAPILKSILIALILLSSLSGFFGKNLPRLVWWISITSAGLLGFVVGILLAPFPESLIVGSCASLGAIMLVLVLRLPRRNQPR